MPDRYLIANWKMNLPPAGMVAYCDALLAAAGSDPQLVVAPPAVVLPMVADRLGPGVAVGAQNCSEHLSGAYTGEVSALMLRDAGARFVVIGHSERRTIYGEADSQVAAKATRVLEAGLSPVLCVGESLELREAGRTDAFLAGQLQAVSVVEEAASSIIVAYEPIWAIGTGRNATGGMVRDTVGAIRRTIASAWGAGYGGTVSILYGGSVTPENANDLVARGEVDGFLVGGASLDARRFLAIREGMLHPRV